MGWDADSLARASGLNGTRGLSRGTGPGDEEVTVTFYELLLARRQREVGRIAAGLDLDFEFGFDVVIRGDELL